MIKPSAKQYIAPISTSLRTVHHETEENLKNRTIDEYYSLSYENSSHTFQCQYWLIFWILGLAQASDAIEANLINFLLASDEFKSSILHDDLKNNGAMLAASCYAGMLFGGIVNGAFGDQLGRRPTLLTGLCLVSVSGVASVFIPNVQTFCVLEFISGLVSLIQLYWNESYILIGDRDAYTFHHSYCYGISS